MNNLSFSFCMANGWQLYKKYGLALAGIFAVFLIVICICALPVSIYAVSLSQNNYEYNSFSFVGTMMSNISNILTSVITWAFSVGFITLVLKLTSGALQKVTFATYKQPLMVYLKYIAVDFLANMAIVIGFFICIVPGLFLAVKLQFAPYYILDRPEAGIDEAFKASWKMTGGDNFWTVFGLVVLNIVIDVVGFLCCGIGLAFAAPYTYLVMSTAYYQLLEVPTPQPGEYYEN